MSLEVCQQRWATCWPVLWRGLREAEGPSSPEMSRRLHASFRCSELFLPTQQAPRYSPGGHTWKAQSPTI